MTDIEVRAAPVLIGVVLIHGETVGIGVRLTIHVITLQLQMGIETVVGIDRQLRLLEDAAGLVLVNIPIGAGDTGSRVRPHAHQGSLAARRRWNIGVRPERQGSIDIALPEGMDTPGIYIIDR